VVPDNQIQQFNVKLNKTVYLLCNKNNKIVNKIVNRQEAIDFVTRDGNKIVTSVSSHQSPTDGSERQTE